MPCVLIVRGQLVTPWELRPWAELPDRFDASYLLTRSNEFDTEKLPLRARRVTSVRDRLPGGALGAAAAGVAGERYLADADEAYAEADVVHAEELSFWFAADAARRKQRHGYRLVQTVWETLPLLRAYRNRHARRYRDEVLAATDLFLPATDRARQALLLEGVEEERMLVCPPGIDAQRFRAPPSAEPPEHVVLSPGRLVWEKGHQDVLRAVALLSRRGLRPQVRLVGRGPEEGRLRAYAEELGLGDRVTIGAVSYEDMPAVFASASCMVLASLPAAMASLHPFGAPPRAFWEEQFGLVLAEAMAARLDILASESGAIPEVLAGQGTLFAPGDWPGLADRLAAGPLARAPGERVEYPSELVLRYSTGAMAERLAAAYDRVLS
jgi:glycosyltransferase involved in cell wall biosynthesis